MTSNRRVYILDQYTQGKNAVYSAWLPKLAIDHEVVTAYDEAWAPPDDAGLICTHLHYTLPEVSILRRITAENRTPVLILADGMLEYRNTWEHPGLAQGAIFQPIMGHKLAAIGGDVNVVAGDSRAARVV